MKLSDAVDQGGSDHFAQLRTLVASCLLDLHHEWAPTGYGRTSAGDLSLDVVAGHVGRHLEVHYDPKNPWESRMRAYIPDVLRVPHRRTGIRDGTGSRTTMLVAWFADRLGWTIEQQAHLRDLITLCMKELSAPPSPTPPPEPHRGGGERRPGWDPLPDAWRAFYTNPAMAESRRLLQYEYEDLVEPMLLRLLDDNLFSRTRPIDVEFSAVEIGMTNLLSVLETVAWADRTGASDPVTVVATFEEWLDRWLRQDRYLALHHYVALRGFRNLTHRLGLFTRDQAEANRRTVAVYGTFRRGETHHGRLTTAVFLGRTAISGRLHRVVVDDGEAARREFDARASDRPRPLDGSIVVEVYRLPDNDFVLADMDGMAVEGDLGAATFRRRLVRLPEDLSDPAFDTSSTAAWVFDWVLSDVGGDLVPSGDWRTRSRAPATDGT